MNIPCRISVYSRRILAVPFARESEAWEEAEEAWEAILEEENVPYDEPLPSPDDWSEGVESAAEEMGTELLTHGLFSYEEDGSWRISYEDTDVTDLPGCLTSFCFSPPEMLTLIRQGPVQTCMVFENGHRHLCDYGIKAGASTVVLNTRSLKSDMAPSGGRAVLDYTVEMRGCRTETNHLTLTVEAETGFEIRI